MESCLQVVEEDIILEQRRNSLSRTGAELLIAGELSPAETLRLLGLLELGVDLEIIGDHAESIAKNCAMLGQKPIAESLVGLHEMTHQATRILRRSLTALAQSDAKLAYRALHGSSEQDCVYIKVYQELMNCIFQDEGSVQRANHLVWVAHDLQLITDRATRITRRVITLISGAELVNSDTADQRQDWQTNLMDAWLESA